VERPSAICGVFVETWPGAGARQGPGAGSANSALMADERILVVEDDPDLRQVMCDYLAKEGYHVVGAADGDEGLRLWRERRPDLIVLDWMLPGASGLDVAHRVRREGATPIVMVTARGEEADMVIGLELGADDYLVKPVSLRLLLARVRAVLRRAHGFAEEDSVLLGDLRLDLAAQRVSRNGAEVELTATEFKLLATLARSPDRVFSRLQLMEAALGDYYEGYERTIDSHVSHLRRKIGMPSLIQTVHGSGYRLVPPGP
jgi:DNA-binding response OmpR family regulator